MGGAAGVERLALGVGVGEYGGMQGSERLDRELLDTLAVCGDLIAVGSVYRFLAEHRLAVFPDELFADLFSGRGRRSQPASVIAVVLVLQALEGTSDREAIERLRCDVRWKAAAGLSLTDGGFHPSVLTLWRARLRRSDRPERVFDAVRAVVAQTGVLADKGRRALDSTLLDDAVATQDTVTMICAQMRRCRRLIPEAAAVAVVAHDYAGRAKPECDWGDAAVRADLIDALVGDALAVLDAVAGAELGDEAADAVGLLGVVAGQDVEADPEVAGRWRIVVGTAADRTISVVDAEARHARKSRSQRRDGYKAHISAEPDTGIICAAALTAANVSDAAMGPALLATEPADTTTEATTTAAEAAEATEATTTEATEATAADTTTEATTTEATTTEATEATEATAADTEPEPEAAVASVREVLADSAYASGEALAAFDAAGYATVIKPIDRAARIAGGYRRGDFAIDTTARTVTCPAGNTATIKPRANNRGTARFGALCATCPQRARCTTSAAGRTVTVDRYEDHRAANKTRWAEPATQARYRRHRPMVERSIAWLTRNKARRVPYRGIAANHQWLTTRAAAVNLTRLGDC